MPVIQGGSNFTIGGDARLYEIQGDAVINHFTDSNELKKIQSIVNSGLPRAQASLKDYETRKKSGPCFPGTREALLREMMDWATEPGESESRMYVLSGLAGIGKSTVIYTLATQADERGLLGASFFFSRDYDDRNNAKGFFTTIAYQLCACNEMFAKAIGDVLLTERGFAATTQDPREQLKVLILEPLQSIVQSCSRRTLIVVDALDECDEEDAFSVLTGLSQLVQDLPSFKVILSTRPQPYLDQFLSSQGGHKFFHLQDIENKVVDGDIRLYLDHNLSMEQVQRRFPKRQWCADNEEIDSLVHAAGRLFIIASTAVLYIFDKTASNPAAQMQKLLRAFATQDHTPLKDLDHFYTIILRNIVPETCDNDDIVSRYQTVVGAIILVQRPLPVSALSHLVDIHVEEIHAVLDKLQSVILLGADDVPRVYHKSFPDYLTDQARCKDPHLRIDERIHHTQIATRCFGIMDKHLKRNILGLGDPTRFMSNEDGITDEQLQEKIPQQLRYSCVYWVNHLKVGHIENAALMNGLEKFADEHMLHCFEVLSLIGKLDSAHPAIDVVLKLLKSTSSDLHRLLLDALRFIGKFYKLIKLSALHTYHSALPFTPTNSLLHHRYIKEAGRNICGIEGGTKDWDVLVADLNHGEGVDVVKFSLDSALIASCSEQFENGYMRKQGKLMIWDATTGIPFPAIPGHRFAVANDFATVTSSEDKTITSHNVNGSAQRAMLTTSSKIKKMALSSESGRVAAGLSDGTIWLWESKNAELIDSFDGFEGNVHWSRLQFSPTGQRLTYSSANGIVKLRDGIGGRSIADLQCGSRHDFEFSSDGSRFASLSYDCGLTLWNSESGALIAAIRDVVGWCGLAISANGSLLATADYNNNVKLWDENCGSLDSLAQFDVQEPGFPESMAFSSDNILAIATTFGIVKLYNVKPHSFISTLKFSGSPTALTFSPDCTRLAVGTEEGRMYLWDIRGIDRLTPSKEEASAVTALACATALTLSRDCSRLACGSEDGTIELWETSSTKRRIPSHQAHERPVRALVFSPDGRLFASGSDDGTIKLWNGKDGMLRGTLKAPSGLGSVALSNSMLVAAGDGGVTLWSLDTLSLIHTFTESSYETPTVSIAENNALIAVAHHDRVSLLDAENHRTITTFKGLDGIHTMTFLPDNLQLVAQSKDGVFLSFNLINEHIIQGPTLERLIQLPNVPLWHDVPVWYCRDKEQHYLAALFSQHKSPVPVLWIPGDLTVTKWTQGSSMIALSCEDGRVILLRLPTGHV